MDIYSCFSLFLLDDVCIQCALRGITISYKLTNPDRPHLIKE